MPTVNVVPETSDHLFCVEQKNLIGNNVVSRITIYLAHQCPTGFSLSWIGTLNVQGYK